MQVKHVLLCALGLITLANCENVSSDQKNETSDGKNVFVGSERGLNFEDFLPCVVQLDMGCMLDRSEATLRDTTKMLMSKFLVS